MSSRISHVNGLAGGAAGQATPPPQGPQHVVLFDPDEVVESPVDEDIGLETGFEDIGTAGLTGRAGYFEERNVAPPLQSLPGTWPPIERGGRGNSRRAGGRRVVTVTEGERPRVSANPEFSVREDLRVGSADFSRVVVEGAFRRHGTGSRDGREGDQTQEEDEEGILERRAEMEPVVEGAIPENDGMQSMREQLLQIKQLAISTEDKARRMHELMTKDYARHIAAVRPHSPALAISPVAQHPTKAQQSTLAPPIDPANPYNLQPGDLEPTISTLPNIRTDANGDVDESVEDSTAPALGCMHYKRNVKVQCFDCHRWFPCRHCHDSAHDLPFAHSLNRKKTQNMLCMLCKTPQPAGETCVNCGEWAAWYYCSICKLWDDDSNKRIYHCDACGLCRLGEGLGKDFVHCQRCNVCISISTSASHPCIERATDSDCPLCLSYLFESPTPVVSLPCGHYMHGACYKDLMAVTYKCPVCSKSAVNMELQWRKLDDEIAMQPMPEDDGELGDLLPHLEGATLEAPAGDTDNETAATEPRRPRKAWIGCNDCNARCWTPFHWLGLKCQFCGGYNTNQMPPTTGHETEAERLIRQQQLQPRQHDLTGNSVLLDAGIGVARSVSEDGDRVDSAFAMPSSPSSLSPATAAAAGSPIYTPGNERRRSAAYASSPRRYFVQPDEPRRASFTTPRFPTPSLPRMPDLPDLPSLPSLPNIPNMPNMPNFPNFPNMPNMPNMPHMPHLPHLPNMPNLELPRFSPLEMVQALSRSLSPMRYYMEGLDAGEVDRFGRPRSSPPGSRARVGRRPIFGPELRPRSYVEGGGEVGVWERYASAVLSSGEEDEDDEDEVEESSSEEEGEEEGEEDGEESGSEDGEDGEMGGSGAAIEGKEEDEDNEDDELALFGHR